MQQSVMHENTSCNTASAGPQWTLLRGSELQTGEKELAGAKQYYEELKPGCLAQRFKRNAENPNATGP